MIHNGFSSQDKESYNYPGTIKQLADRVRNLAFSVMTQAEFARLCMEFNHNVVPSPDKEAEIRYTHLLELVAQNLDPRHLELGAVWLDGHGWGQMSLEQLGLEIKRIRETQLS